MTESTKCAALAAMRRARQDGQKRRPLQLNATRISFWHAARATRAKPRQSKPQSRKARSALSTKRGRAASKPRVPGQGFFVRLCPTLIYHRQDKPLPSQQHLSMRSQALLPLDPGRRAALAEQRGPGPTRPLLCSKPSTSADRPEAATPGWARSRGPARGRRTRVRSRIPRQRVGSPASEGAIGHDPSSSAASVPREAP